MKKNSFKGLAAVALIGASVTGCKLLGDLDYELDHDPVQMHGDSVRVKVTVTVPKKGIHKKVVAEITPKLGNKEYKVITIQGEKAEGNGIVIPKEGKKVSYEDVVPYDPSMENSDLTISGVARKKKKEIEVPETKIADGTIITPFWVQPDDKALIGNDAFQRVTEEMTMAQINYLKGKHNVRSTEYKDQDVKDIQAFMADAQTNVKVEPKRVDLVAYASPEGEVAKNNDLAGNRATTGKEASIEIAKKAKNEKLQGEDLYNPQPKGEDWEGFKSQLDSVPEKKIPAEEKALIVRILEMYKDPQTRETEMKKLSKTFRVLEKEVLPPLRRTQIQLVYDLTGYSDEELIALSKSNPDTLNVEELLFTATLTEDLNEKLRLYKEVQRQYPDDWRGYNNVGYVYYMQNKLDDAKSEFEKASAKEEHDEIFNNLGIIARIQGDRVKGKELLEKAGGSDETKYNLGIIAIQDGDYETAISNMGDNKTFNKALGQLLHEQYEDALKTIDESDDKETAIGYYLKAILGSRQGNFDMVKNNLKSAVAKDASLKAKAAKDREFIKFFENAEFQAIVQ
ncbi:MAG: hypothetical protein KDC84_02855 [Crocinitomicaceae bacterium]|nr:hypothetical protein [Crocinitomicaceae bacterium]